MPRPRKIKIVESEPEIDYFKPRAVPLKELEEVELTVDELESIRLANISKLSQSEAAKKMNIHQSTFQRTLCRARDKVADALLNGKAIKICGGVYKMPGGDGSGPRGQGTFAGSGTGAGRGRMGGPKAGGPTGSCKCAKCGYTRTHLRGVPCNKIKCPKCGTIMTR
jgi:predicted DNA-binding protein (UPF0251 family)